MRRLWSASRSAVTRCVCSSLIMRKNDCCSFAREVSESRKKWTKAAWAVENLSMDSVCSRLVHIQYSCSTLSTSALMGHATLIDLGNSQKNTSDSYSVSPANRRISVKLLLTASN